MNIRFHLIVPFSCIIFCAFSNEYTGKQKAILVLNALEGNPWHSTAPQHDIDPLFTLQHSLSTHPGLPSFATVFCTRNPRVAQMDQLIDISVFEETPLQPFSNSAQQLTLQEHVCGIQLGQLWSQDNLEIGWQWWVGARERNWWLPRDAQANFNVALQNFTDSTTKNARSDRYAAQEVNHRLTYWHTTSTTIGMGDVHLHIRYRIPLHARLFCAVGLYGTIPVGTQAQRATTPDAEDIPPLNGEELAMRLIHRARDIMLCVPLGNNGHLGIGGHINAGFAISKHWSLRSQFTQLYYRSGIESRFTLTPATPLTKLEEGMPGTMIGISSDAEIITHLKQKLYPTEAKLDIKPGMMRTWCVNLHYEGLPLYGAIGYAQEIMESEYSETAPLATLTHTKRENHKITATTGLRRRYGWGETSWYATGNYTVQGSAHGAWGLGIGVSAQG